MIASIGSCNVSSEDFDLFQYPSMTTITNIEYSLEQILGPGHVKATISAVSATEANIPSGIKPTDLSKLWIILENLAECAIERKMKLMMNKYDIFCLETSQQMTGFYNIE